MNQTPLNPDALEAAAKATYDFRNEDYDEQYHDLTYGDKEYEWLSPARVAVSAYLAVAQPVVNSVEEAERLPHMSVILDSEGCAWQRNGHQNGWATWSALGDEFFTSAIDAFPARVLYRPEVNNGR